MIRRKSLSFKAVSLLGVLVLSLFSHKYACGQVITGYGVKAGPSIASLDFKYADSTDWDRKNRLDYLAIPVLTKLILTNGTHAPYFFMGPRLDFFIGYDSIFSFSME